MKSGNKIVFNTAILYGRMLITIGISLYSTRLILSNLGASDYGLYNVVGGVIAMLSFLNAAMTTSTQRYLSFNMGVGDMAKIKRVLGNSMLIHILLGLLLVVVFEVLGSYFLETKLNIEPDRLSAAKIIFHFTVISSFVSIVSVPYDAVVNAHENMAFVALINILESVLKLVVALLLTYVLQDKLVVYGFLTMVSAVLIRIIKQVYCRRKYQECSVHILKVYDRTLMKEMGSFASWNLFGVICGLSRSQGVAVVLNLFYSTVVNAAYSIANQVNNQMSFLSMTMMKTIRPQMMKSEGAGDRQRMLRLSVFAGKFSFYLNAIVSIPMFIAMPQVLAFWLGQVPEYTISFCRYMLILNLTQQFSMGIMAATQAIGNIKRYQLVVGTVQILTVPISYFALRAGYPAEAVMVSTVSLEFVASYFRVYYFHALTAFSISVFLKEIVLTPLIPSSIVFLIARLSYEHITLNSNIWHLAPFFIVTIFLYVVLIYLAGISVQERTMINNIVRMAFGKVAKIKS
uniref:Multi antimicrobial extrusion protein MatE n=1 Tax=Sphingobacterium sp. (strain 21) TaxID=743722 RepID=F4CA78_SPHS2